MEKVIVATLLCDHKLYSAKQMLEHTAKLEAPEGVEVVLYVNVETAPGNTTDLEGYEFLDDIDGLHYDAWAWESTWRGNRCFDQDQQHRLSPIVMARNMAREFALLTHADAILYIDSDVLVPLNSLVELWNENLPIVGGMVPGRGCHSHVSYMGSGKHLQAVDGRDNLVRTDYATAGFVLIRKPVFQVIPWRWGWSATGGGPHSEDPLYGESARIAGFGWWHVRNLVAEHLDNPDAPLEPDGVASF